MTPIIEIKNLKKYFATPRGMLHAVDDVTLSIQKGKTLGVVGESGCGKSTLGRTIIHLLESTGGQILFNGGDITKLNNKELRRVRESMQIIFQDPYSSLDPRKTVEETIREPLVVSKKYKKQQIDEQIEQLMALVGIDARLRNSFPHALDGGRRQRVGIARALAINPQFIVCDEPVSALDVSIQAQVLNLLKELQKMCIRDRCRYRATSQNRFNASALLSVCIASEYRHIICLAACPCTFFSRDRMRRMESAFCLLK